MSEQINIEANVFIGLIPNKDEAFEPLSSFRFTSIDQANTFATLAVVGNPEYTTRLIIQQVKQQT